MLKGLIWEYAEFWRQKEARNKKPHPKGLDCWWGVGGESRGYWAEIRRSRPEREAEARHSTSKRNRFRQYWADGTRSRTASRSNPLWFPYAAPPPRVSVSYLRYGILGTVERRTASAASNRWSAEAPGLRPYGLRPYKRKWQQAIASRVITDRLRLSDDPFNYQRLRDLKAHILERRRESGAAFQDNQWDPKSPECQRGIYWAEMEGIELHRRHDRLRWFIDGPVNDEVIDQKLAKKGDPYLAERIPHGRDSQLAAINGFELQELQTTQTRRRQSYGRPLRERRKAGRKPIGPIAMSGAERKRKHDQNKRLQALSTPERPQTGPDQPLPLGWSAPVTIHLGDPMDVFDRLGAALAKANAAPLDANVFDVLSLDEFYLIALAAQEATRKGLT